jgi:NADH-quinone oxidoreductase subunit I
MLGEGIAKGFIETARNFFGSYFSKDRLTTVQYPEERSPQAEAARNFPFLVYDGDDWQAGMRCVGCQICEKRARTRRRTSWASRSSIRRFSISIFRCA